MDVGVGVQLGRPGGLVAAIEAGGTKFVCAAGRSWEELRSGPRGAIPTGRPDETMAAVTEWFASTGLTESVGAVGVASFGPLDIAAGRIGPTPKPGWAGFDWSGAVHRWLPGVPVAVETDTIAAALAESEWGAATGRRVVVYLTVGTGIGGGLVVEGRAVHGLVHPEMGHMRVPRVAGDDFPGRCPFHGDCLEGLASGPAIEARWGRGAPELPADHPAWRLEARYLGAAVANVALTVSPEVIVMGGGVMAAPGLLALVRAATRELVGGYVDSELLGDGVDRYLVAPALGGDSGVLGAFLVGSVAVPTV